jgi:hypothetical protein
MHELPWREGSGQRSDTAPSRTAPRISHPSVGSIRVHGANENKHLNSKDLTAEQTSEVTAYLATL